jgi:hypothetical protein
MPRLPQALKLLGVGLGNSTVTVPSDQKLLSSLIFA